ncbi:hypothetical protein DFQ11_107144 [Winogradskyella epiphytica]|uniref:Secreted protein n=1 Tax=Winogradskyella epiphytica TaxID=262005 RepID=A0A2V4WU29_9FLAO|nr:hypothetical protein [Winogradskyella epiphytica]PYE80172.1 hypothetical protein DFQ11_107144 [Winogradskyella epiphytica]GGW71801.1 hypothetical protein GCM10008085_25050 [Winogradskyella epiphytica]
MKAIICFLLLLPFHITAQEQTSSEKFWEQLKAHCGQVYEGEITAGGVAGDGFMGEKLVMHVRSCDTNDIRIPFFVGEDRSRTWVLHMNEDKIIRLKHDHRKPDGSDDDLTQYGGTSSNVGLSNIQVFPADSYTSEILPAASTNIWWFTIDETSLTYNLRRIGSDRVFTVRFDLTKAIETPEAPWGAED